MNQHENSTKPLENLIHLIQNYKLRDRISFNNRYEVIALSEYELNEFEHVLQSFINKKSC